jgi:hypothetical protein
LPDLAGNLVDRQERDTNPKEDVLMAIDLSNTAPQRIGGVTVTVTGLAGANLPRPDKGHTVAHAWRLDINPPASAATLANQQIQAPANPAATTFFQGVQIAAPVPDAAWNALPATVAGGLATATLANSPYPLGSPLYIAYGT